MTSITSFFSVSRRPPVVEVHEDQSERLAPEVSPADAESQTSAQVRSGRPAAVAAATPHSTVTLPPSTRKRNRSHLSSSPVEADQEQQPSRAKNRTAAAAVRADEPAFRPVTPPWAANQQSAAGAIAVEQNGVSPESSGKDVPAAAGPVTDRCSSSSGSSSNGSSKGKVTSDENVAYQRDPRVREGQSDAGDILSADCRVQRCAAPAAAQVATSGVAPEPVASPCSAAGPAAPCTASELVHRSAASTSGVAGAGSAPATSCVTSISYVEFLKSCAESAEGPSRINSASMAPAGAGLPSTAARPQPRVTVVVADVHRAADQPSPCRPAAGRRRSNMLLADANGAGLLPAFANCVSQARLSIDVVQVDGTSGQFSGRATLRSRRLPVSDASVKDGSGSSSCNTAATAAAALADVSCAEASGLPSGTPCVVAPPAAKAASSALLRGSGTARDCDQDSASAKSSVSGSAAIVTSGGPSSSSSSSSSGGGEDCEMPRRPRRSAAIRAADAIVYSLSEENSRRTGTACSRRRSQADDASTRQAKCAKVAATASANGHSVPGSDDQTKRVPAMFRRDVRAASHLAVAAAASSRTRLCSPATEDKVDLTCGEPSDAQQLDPDRTARKAKAGVAGGGLELYPSEPWQVVHVQQLPCEAKEQHQQQAHKQLLGSFKFKLRCDSPSLDVDTIAVPLAGMHVHIKDLLEVDCHRLTSVRLTKMLDQTPAFSLNIVRQLLKDIASKTPGRAVNRSYKRLCARSGRPLPAEDISKDSSPKGASDPTGTPVQQPMAAAAAATTVPDAVSSGTKDSCKGDDLWTEKYRPLKSDELLANSGAIAELRQWLVDWRAAMSRESGPAAEPSGGPAGAKQGRPQRKQARRADDGSDSDTCDSADDAGPCNMALITGPPGCGKTAAVYALAGELGFKVFELNPSSARTYKHILDQLQEVTQSHHFDSSAMPAGGLPLDAEPTAFALQPSTSAVMTAAKKPAAPANTILSFFTGRPKLKQGDGKPTSSDDACQGSAGDVTVAALVGEAAGQRAKSASAVVQDAAASRPGVGATESTAAARGRPRRQAATIDDSPAVEQVSASTPASAGRTAAGVSANTEPAPARRDLRRLRRSTRDGDSSSSGVGDTALTVDGANITVAARSAIDAATAQQVLAPVGTSGARPRTAAEDSEQQPAAASSGKGLTSFSLVLFEEADVIFEEDRGFWAAVQALLRDTKKPIILTAAAAVPPSLPAFPCGYRHIKMECPPVCHLAAYLSEICVAENTSVDFDDLLHLVHSCQADVRRAVLQLQCLVQSGSVGCRCRTGSGSPAPPGSAVTTDDGASSSAATQRPAEHLLFAAEDAASQQPSHAAHVAHVKSSCRAADAAAAVASPQQPWARHFGRAMDSCPPHDRSAVAMAAASRLLSDLALLEPEQCSAGSSHDSLSDGEPRTCKALPCRCSHLLPGLADKAPRQRDAGWQTVSGGSRSHGVGDALGDDIWYRAVQLSCNATGHVGRAPYDSKMSSSVPRLGADVDRARWLSLCSSSVARKKPCYNLCERPHCNSSYAPVTVEEAAVSQAAELIIGYGGVGQTKAAIGCEYLPAIRSICEAEAIRKTATATTAAAAEGCRRRESSKRRFHHHLFELPEDVQHALSVSGFSGSPASAGTRVPTT